MMVWQEMVREKQIKIMHRAKEKGAIMAVVQVEKASCEIWR